MDPMTRPKPTVGQVLYSLNVGNRARHAEQVLKPVVVRKVGRKYFTCGPEDGGPYNETDYHLDDWLEKTEFLADSALYSSPQEYEDEKQRHAILDEFRKLFTGWGGSKVNDIPLSTLRKIKELLP
jgi:hypothetical protein